MLASYLLARTLVPTLASMHAAGRTAPRREACRTPRARVAVSRPRSHCTTPSSTASTRLGAAPRPPRSSSVLAPAQARCSSSPWLLALAAWRVGRPCALGREFFPTTDAGLLRLCSSAWRAASASRTPPAQIAEVQREIRALIPPAELRLRRREPRRAEPRQPGLGRDHCGDLRPTPRVLVQLGDGDHAPTADLRGAASAPCSRDKFPGAADVLPPGRRHQPDAGSRCGDHLRGALSSAATSPGNLALARELTAQNASPRSARRTVDVHAARSARPASATRIQHRPRARGIDASASTQQDRFTGDRPGGARQRAARSSPNVWADPGVKARPTTCRCSRPRRILTVGSTSCIEPAQSAPSADRGCP
jgi:hypothetical protein